MKTLVSILLLTLSLAAFSTTSYTAEDGIKSGPLHAVDLKNNRLIINDRTRYLAPGYVVKNKKGEVVSVFSLKRGQFLEYKINEDRQVTEIIIGK
jgi:hypothetical protein